MLLSAFRMNLDRVSVSRTGGLDPTEHTKHAALPHTSLEAPSEACRYAKKWVCLQHGANAISAVQLAVNEMVTQAVRSNAGTVLVGVSCRTTVLAVSVIYDEAEALRDDERLRLADDMAARIIEGVSRAAGIDVVDGKQRLWCTIPTGVPAGPSPRRRSGTATVTAALKTGTGVPPGGVAEMGTPSA